jgi:hypothetical protein
MVGFQKGVSNDFFLKRIILNFYNVLYVATITYFIEYCVIFEFLINLESIVHVIIF